MSATAFLDGRVMLHPGDCLAVVRALPSGSIDSCVTDPPYALVSIGKRFGAEGVAPVVVPEGRSGAYARASAGFMGKTWDTGETAFAVAFWAEVLRVLKPGAHVVAFGGTRSYHRLACAIEDAGFEIRDQLAWCYGSGFPKSHDVSKRIDRKRDDRDAIFSVTRHLAEAAALAGVSRADVDCYMGTSDMAGWWLSNLRHRCQCPQWEQWLKLKVLLGLGDTFDAEVWRLNGRKGQPGNAWLEAKTLAVDRRTNEPSGIVACGRERKSVDRLIKAANSDAAREWKGWGTALKPAWEPIVLARKPLIGTVAENVLAYGTGALNVDGCRVEAVECPSVPATSLKAQSRYTGILNGGLSSSPEARTTSASARGRWPANLCHDGSDEVIAAFPATVVAGSADKRASKSAGILGRFDGTETVARGALSETGSAARFFYSAKADADDRLGSKHPTVKPVDLMRWLVRLVTPPGGIVLDPFAGTGTTGEAAYRESMRAVLIEREAEYQADIARRMKLILAGPLVRRAAAAKAAADHGPLFADPAS